MSLWICLWTESSKCGYNGFDADEIWLWYESNVGKISLEDAVYLDFKMKDFLDGTTYSDFKILVLKLSVLNWKIQSCSL